MTKLIIFDFGGVLGSDADEWQTTFSQIPILLGLPTKVVSNTFSGHWPELKIGQESMEDFWEDIKKISPNPQNIDIAKKSYYSSVYVNKKVMNLAKILKNKGYKLAILANESREGMKNKIKKFALNKTFDKIFCSADIGIAKPDNKSFKLVLKYFNTIPSETIFIDNQQNNICAAIKLGINPILFTNSKKLRLDLKAFGIL